MNISFIVGIPEMGYLRFILRCGLKLYWHKWEGFATKLSSFLTKIKKYDTLNNSFFLTQLYVVLLLSVKFSQKVIKKK